MSAFRRFARSSDHLPGVAAIDGGPLDSLRGWSFSGCYRTWRGLSGKRYVVSVFPVDPTAADRGLPMLEGFVLLSVARRGQALAALDVQAVETDAGRERAVASGLARGAAEWHVHFLADDRGRRRAVVADLHAAQERPAAPSLSA